MHFQAGEGPSRDLLCIKTGGSFAALRRMLTEAVLSVSRVQAPTSTVS